MPPLLLPGYWPTTYFPRGQWDPDYWPHFLPEPPEPEEVSRWKLMPLPWPRPWLDDDDEVLVELG